MDINSIGKLLLITDFLSYMVVEKSCTIMATLFMAHVNSSLAIAQITDIHLFADPTAELRGLRTIDSLEQVLVHLRQIDRQLNALLLTGDLSQDETIQSYQHLRSAFQAFDLPIYWIPGNHDHPALMSQVLNVPPWMAQKHFQLGGWNFLLLDSTLPGCTHGKLSTATLSWLDACLSANPEQPTLIALHHPPVLIGSTWMDELGLHESQLLLDVIDRHPQVKVVIFGHVHQVFDTTRNGVRYLATPSSCVQFAPKQAEIAIDDLPPGFRRLQLHADGAIETRIEWADRVPNLR